MICLSQVGVIIWSLSFIQTFGFICITLKQNWLSEFGVIIWSLSFIKTFGFLCITLKQNWLSEFYTDFNFFSPLEVITRSRIPLLLKVLWQPLDSIIFSVTYGDRVWSPCHLRMNVSSLLYNYLHIIYGKRWNMVSGDI